MRDALRYIWGAMTTLTFCPFTAFKGFAASRYSWSPGWHTPAAAHCSHALFLRTATLAMLPSTSATTPSSSIMIPPKHRMAQSAKRMALCSSSAPCSLRYALCAFLLRPQQFVLDAVHQRLPARLDHVLGHAHGAPFIPAVSRFDQHAHPGGRPLGRRQHSYFVVDQPYVFEPPPREIPRQHLAKGLVQSVHGTVAPGGRMLDVPAHFDRNGRFAHRVRVDFPLLRQNAVIDPVEHAEHRLVIVARAEHEKFERALGALELITLVLESFDLPEDAGEFGAVLRERYAQLCGLLKDVALSRHVRHEDAPPVPDEFRGNMFIGQGALCNGVHVHPALVRKSAVADVGLPLAVRQVRKFIHIPGQVPQLRKIAVGDAIDPHLELQGRDDGAEIGVPAPLAVAVHRSVDLHGPHPDRSERVCHGQFCVVMCMNPEGGFDTPLYLLYNLFDFVRQRTAVRI